MSKIETIGQAIEAIEMAGFYCSYDLKCKNSITREDFIVTDPHSNDGGSGLIFASNSSRVFIEFARKCQLKAFW